VFQTLTALSSPAEAISLLPGENASVVICPFPRIRHVTCQLLVSQSVISPSNAAVASHALSDEKIAATIILLGPGIVFTG